MTDQLTNQEVTEQEIDTNSREYWKQEAEKLALSYPNNMPTDKLRNLVQETLKIRELAKSSAPQRGLNASIGALAPEVRAMQDSALSLVRFRLTVLDPNKRNATGIFVSAGNDNIAPVRRMIPFNAPVWHAERIIVEHLKNIKYTSMQSRYNERMKSAFDDPSTRKLMPCFLIEELPPLTEEELAGLQQLQAQQGTGQTDASQGN